MRLNIVYCGTDFLEWVWSFQLGDIQKASGDSPQQPALGGLTSAAGLD